MAAHLGFSACRCLERRSADRPDLLGQAPRVRACQGDRLHRRSLDIAFMSVRPVRTNDNDQVRSTCGAESDARMACVRDALEKGPRPESMMLWFTIICSGAIRGPGKQRWPFRAIFSRTHAMVCFFFLLAPGSSWTDAPEIVREQSLMRPCSTNAAQRWLLGAAAQDRSIASPAADAAGDERHQPEVSVAENCFGQRRNRKACESSLRLRSAHQPDEGKREIGPGPQFGLLLGPLCQKMHPR